MCFIERSSLIKSTGSAKVGFVNCFWKYDECAICKTKKELEPHHIIKTDKSKELYYDLNNGVLLCHRCHRLYHKLFSEINPSTLLEFSQEYSQKLKKWVK